MQFDPENEVVKRCAQGMELEGVGEKQQAAALLREAWAMARTDLEKFTAAHYVARNQATIEDKLHWDTTALNHALRIKGDATRSVLPSLYLNVGKGYEDLGDRERARLNYTRAMEHFDSLPDDEYGTLVRNGVVSGLKRVER
ncbi:rRNA adenine methyltransferase [Lewinella sp. IMCC34183]|uniref:rRNA adenine methyltransferase n=1 Tax=Lewinella sp. IMCC34183 TaxID=2248762 RepID=UPI000E246F1B|nr:rRNA adenine methyltransferase [Lewinella sp. IMCC34183]